MKNGLYFWIIMIIIISSGRCQLLDSNTDNNNNNSVSPTLSPAQQYRQAKQNLSDQWSTLAPLLYDKEAKAETLQQWENLFSNLEDIKSVLQNNYSQQSDYESFNRLTEQLKTDFKHLFSKYEQIAADYPESTNSEQGLNSLNDSQTKTNNDQGENNTPSPSTIAQENPNEVELETSGEQEMELEEPEPIIETWEEYFAARTDHFHSAIETINQSCINCHQLYRNYPVRFFFKEKPGEETPENTSSEE